MLFRKIIILLSLFFLWIYIHELTHYTIGESFNCEPEYALTWQGPSVTYYPSLCDDPETVGLLNGINEIVGYNIMPALLLIIAVMIFRK